MATLDLIPPDFWESPDLHIAVPPERPGEAAGLAEFASQELGASGWCFFQTSGSEGRPRWVALTKAALRDSARAVNAHFHITAQDHWLQALPTHHVGGFGILARASLSGSAITRLDGKWNAIGFVQRCAESRATLASLVPTQVFDLVAARLACPPAMRMVLVGGGALSEDIRQSALQLGWPICRTYGMTETCSQVASQTPHGDEEMEVLPLWQLSTDAHDVLTIRGPALAQGHAVGDQDGIWHWQPIAPEAGLRTRDRVSLWIHDGRQFLRFLGRESGTVKILGELVALAPIQEQLDTLRLRLGLEAADAAVCDVPDARKEAALVLVTSQMGEADLVRLQLALNANLRPLEQISQTRQVPAIPRSDLGKVRLAELRALL